MKSQLTQSFSTKHFTKKNTTLSTYRNKVWLAVQCFSSRTCC